MKKSLKERYIESCLKTCNEDEFVDKRKRRAHNAAATWRYNIHKKMMAENDKCMPLAQELLSHPSEKVRLSIGAYCLMAHILVDQAIETLNEIKANSSDRCMQFTAEMTISVLKTGDGSLS